jgi:protein gp37
MKTTKIEWTEATWNPTTGCNKVSAGCKNCYAETMAFRLKAMGTKGYEDGFKFTIHPSRLIQPLNRKKPTKYFVNSMSDLFHEDCNFEYIDRIIDVIKKTPRHTYQILTKRAHIMYEYFRDKEIPNNIWLGVTVEDRKSGIPRIEYLRKLNVKIRFLSVEPLLEDLGNVDFTNIQWVIVGGESGHKARPMKEEWAVNVRKQCEKYNSLFFFKQWGTWGADNVKRSKKANGRLLEGKIWNSSPEAIIA